MLTSLDENPGLTAKFPAWIVLNDLFYCVAASCRVDDLRAHFKNTYETARACRGLNLHKAIEYMDRVLEHKSVIPFRRFNDGIGHKAMSK